MQKPRADAVVDGDIHSFFTREGYYAYGMQGVVDADCKFISISMQACSSTAYILSSLSTHDSTAYIRCSSLLRPPEIQSKIIQAAGSVAICAQHRWYLSLAVLN